MSDIDLHRDLIGEDNLLFLTLVASTLFALLVGVCFHEFCHALAAHRLGDRTPQSQGRVTLNPFAHLDPLGTFMMLFIGFGWGKPVQFNPYGVRTDPKTATLIVAAAGKSALAPFSGWLPRAMEGPTPSSAIFYGALSVHLGAFLLLRVSPLLDASPTLSGVVVGVGLLTALYAYLVGSVQTDISESRSLEISRLIAWCSRFSSAGRRRLASSSAS